MKNDDQEKEALVGGREIEERKGLKFPKEAILGVNLATRGEHDDAATQGLLEKADGIAGFRRRAIVKGNDLDGSKRENEIIHIEGGWR